MLREQTLTEVTKQAAECSLPVQRLVLDPLDHTAYHRTLASLWHDGTGFILVEHDVVPPPGAFERFIQCPHLVCAHPYPCGADDPVLALGCTRFSPELLEEFPFAMEDAADPWNEAFPAMHWKRLDVRLFGSLAKQTIQCHSHLPPATHLHAYPS